MQQNAAITSLCKNYLRKVRMSTQEARMARRPSCMLHIKSGRTALMFAAENGQKNICLLLVDAMLDRSMLPGTMVAFLGIKKFHKSKFFKLIDPHIIKQIAHQACTNAPTMKDLFEQISEISDEAVKIDLCTHAQKRLKFRDQSRNDRLCIIA
jgi:ankyrin repeat protein